MNTWMTNPQVLAQFAHFFGGYAILMTAHFVAASLGRPHAPHVAAALLVAYAAIKEFWWDMRYEFPKQTWGDSLEDFAFYAIGGGAGWFVAWAIRSLGSVA